MKKILFLIFSFFILFYSCSEFIEYPLEEEEIILLAPSNNYSTSDSLITFWWTKHPDAKFYHLQIVQPDFMDVNKLIIDSIVMDDKLSLKLKPGLYSWRVRPENNGSVGLFVERTFQIINFDNEN